ncbi:MAG: hypothetical protein ACRDLN_10810 [Solirubrobacteraceae bacterium]
MDDVAKRKKDIAYAYQCGMEDGSRLDRELDDAEVTKLGIERGEAWAAAACGDAPYPDRL